MSKSSTPHKFVFASRDGTAPFHIVPDTPEPDPRAAGTANAGTLADHREFKELNENQRSAVHNVLVENRAVTVVHGPPGTGKSKTLVALVRLFIDTHPGEKVLVVGPSNENVGNLCEKFTAAQAKHARQGEEESPTMVVSVATSAQGEVITKAAIVLCTYSQAAVVWGSGASFDLFVLDEASQVAETLILVPLMCMKPGSRLVLAGDCHPMRPFSKLTDPAHKKCRSKSLMERLHEESRDSLQRATLQTNSSNQLCHINYHIAHTC